MAAFLLKRLLWSVPVLFFAVTLTFVLIRMAPGSPFITEKAMSAEVKAELEKNYGLQGNILEQTARYWWNLLRGEFGSSTQYKNRSVAEILAQTLPKSLAVGSIAFFLAIVAGTALGAWSALNASNWKGDAIRLVALAGICAPSFLSAPLVVLWLGIEWRLLPVAGWGTASHLILPALCLAIPYIAVVSRLMRVSFLEILGQDYIRTARAKGLSESSVLFGHALKNALLPLISYSGPLAAHLLTGSLIVEQIFKIPGMGMFFVGGVLNLDVFLVGGCVIVYCTLLVAFNIAADILYAAVDPRIKVK